MSLYFYNLDYSSTFYFFSGFGFEVGFLKWILIVFLIVGITNSTNLTDGLDGLVAGSSSVSFGGILIISFWIFRHPDYYINFMNNEMVGLELSTLISALAGSTLGFLWWNTILQNNHGRRRVSFYWCYVSDNFNIARCRWPNFLFLLPLYI